MKRFVLLLTLFAVLVLAGCAPEPIPGEELLDEVGDPAGFWLGLWHGFIMLFTFIISLFKDSVAVYQVHNTGNWYNFGYVLGAMIFFSSGGRGSAGRCGK
jgi:hypothetical protein